MKRQPFRERIHDAAIKLLRGSRSGLRFSELERRLWKRLPECSRKTVTNSILSLESDRPDHVYRPARGVYRSTLFRGELVLPPPSDARHREEQFYSAFALWLKAELLEVSHAIVLGGNVFKDRWGTPDVLGKSEGRPSDLIKSPTSIVAAEIKADSNGLLLGFGQACAYRLFSHKSYLVIPKQTPATELDRVEALCRLYCLGLVVFDKNSTSAPRFTLLVRPIRHEPDLFYTNRYLKQVERQLF
jgi:hypothetical protein